MVASAQRLTREGVPMVEYPQTVPNLTDSSQNLFDLIRGRNLRVYPAEDIRRAVAQAIAIEGPRGWRIAKSQQSHKIDVVVALAMASLAAVRSVSTSRYTLDAWRDGDARGVDVEGSREWRAARANEAEWGWAKRPAGIPADIRQMFAEADAAVVAAAANPQPSLAQALVAFAREPADAP
jgi:hypothetical protein